MALEIVPSKNTSQAPSSPTEKSGGWRWKARRLRCMSAAEVLHRLGEGVSAQIESRTQHRVKAPVPQLERVGIRLLSGSGSDFGKDTYRSAADFISRGDFDLFGRAVSIGFPPDWNRDPETGIRSPLTFGKTINYRDESLVGNIKTLWEPSRHLQLVTLAQQYSVSGDEKYAQAVLDLISSWIDQCPHPIGIHWSSSLELAIRLCNWAVAWSLLGGLSSSVFKSPRASLIRDRWLESIYLHCRFIKGHLSRFSSANNHLLGELMGIYIASTVWPHWNDVTRWGRAAFIDFADEALKQNSVDGVNREQALYYHHEVADMMVLVLRAARLSGTELPQEYAERLERMLDFILAVLDSSGNAPMWGDADDALMLRLHHEENWCPYKSLLAIGAVLFDRADFKAASRQFDSKAQWLLGPEGQSIYDSIDIEELCSQSITRSFPEGGYSILGSRFGSSEEIKLIADSGPLGYLSIAAHGHADALSFTLNVAGKELLVDPGTYSYHTERAWRDYFRGTSAHNTVQIDGVDQSEIGGTFMWMRKAQTTLQHSAFGDERDIWIASHDGYEFLADPVTHERQIETQHADRRILVSDRLGCRARHRAVVSWHFAENVVIRQVGPNRFEARSDNVRMLLTATSTAALTSFVSRGDTSPDMGGWISRRLGHKDPAFTLRFRADIQGSTIIETEIQLLFDAV